MALGVFVTAAAIAFLVSRLELLEGMRFRRSFIRKSNVQKHGEGLDIGNRVSTASAPVYAANIVGEYKHDLDAFTQGLVWHEGALYESTGLRGKSSVRRVDLETGKVVDTHKLKLDDFGEGLCISGKNGDKIVQVLWKMGKGYVYNRETLEQQSEFDFEGDGWGLASMPGRPEEIFLSDGSSKIRVYRLDDGRLKKLRDFTVRDGTKEVGLLNELEVIGGELWANVWYSDFVARIDMETGTVKSWVDLRGLLKRDEVPKGHSVDVLNGIAWDKNTGSVFVTGKLWPKLYSIVVTDRVVAQSVAGLGNAFFLDPEQVRYVHKHVLM